MAHEYALKVLWNDQANTWVFSDGSVAGLNRNITGGGYVIAKPDKSNNIHNIANNIINENSIYMNDGSIALAELVGMKAAFQHVLTSNNVKMHSIF